MKNPGQQFLTIFLLCSGLLLSIGISLAWYIGAPAGDLMRIGRMASIDWRIQTPQAPLTLSPPTQPAQLLVLGDSFSNHGKWQSVLYQRTGVTAQTYRYNDIGCLGPWLAKEISKPLSQGAAPFIIIETVEREFMNRFKDPDNSCMKDRPLPVVIKDITLKSDPDNSIFPIDINYLSDASRHHFFKAQKKGRLKSKSAITVDLTQDKLFSNRLSLRLAYLDDDEDKWKGVDSMMIKKAMTNAKTIIEMANAHHKKLFFVVIPDKSTTYQPWVVKGQMPLPPYQLFKELENTLGSQQNFLPVFRHSAKNTTDFFSPDDTHLSLSGYRILADEIASRFITGNSKTLSTSLETIKGQ